MEKTVYFRAFEPEDAALIHQWKNDEKLNELTIGLNKKTTLEDDLNWVNSIKNHHPYYAYWAICAKENDKMIGYASLVNIHYINSSAETGAVMIADPDYHDGSAWLEAVLHLLEYGFESLNLHRVYGRSIIGNHQSNLMEKLLFMHQDGVMRDAEYKNGRYYDVSFAAILDDEYFAHKEAGDYEIKSMIKRIRTLRHG